MQSLKVDPNKIKFIKCDINTWRERHEEKMLRDKYYIYRHEGLSQFGSDKIHFDRNHRNSETT